MIEEALNLAYHGGRAQDQSFNITLERDFADTIVPIELVPQDITRVCLNLFGNGFYATTKRQREGGDPKFKPTLKVSTRDFGYTVELKVRDNGIGIAHEIKNPLNFVNNFADLSVELLGELKETTARDRCARRRQAHRDR